ncbi:MAG TPA: DUF2252 family protein [Gemmatimonadaceae bacterium]|nr:DUF2252 family protein [Gemmatimonadaceae bacterium]
MRRTLAHSASNVIDRIARFNAGREPERLALKFRAMRGSAFAFLRATAHLFWEDWHASYRGLAEAPLVWATGDLHLENVGSFLGDNRLVYFDLNDFDEGTLAPATWELGRFLTSVHIAAKSLEISNTDAGELVTTFLDAYCAALTDGKARWVERAVATGMVRELLDNVKGRTRETLLDTRTIFGRRRRQLRVDSRRALEIEKRDRERVAAAIERFGQSMPEPRFFKVLDVARRVAGTASLGVRRYVVLVRGTGSPDGNWLLDLKEARPSALTPFVDLAQPSWPNDAERIVRIQHRMQAISPALLRAVELHGAHFVLRELQPTEDRLALEHWHRKLGRLCKVMTTIGHLVAWAQLRSSSRDGSASTDDLIAFAAQRRWRRELVRAAADYSKRVERDWREFKRASKEVS